MWPKNVITQILQSLYNFISTLECLQKTPPPVLVFAERKQDVDAIHEYLLLKGIEAVSTHGDKDQEERNKAVQEFRSGIKDILGTSRVFLIL